MAIATGCTHTCHCLWSLGPCLWSKALLKYIMAPLKVSISYIKAPLRVSILCRYMLTLIDDVWEVGKGELLSRLLSVFTRIDVEGKILE